MMTAMWPDQLEEISSSPKLARFLWILVVLMLCALCVFLHAISVSKGELPLDDAGTWGVATRSLRSVVTLPIEFHSQPPLYYLVLHYIAKISDVHWVLRGFSLACCLGLIGFILFSGAELSLLSRVVFALLFMVGELGDYLASAVRPYGMAALLVTISLFLFLRQLAEPTSKRVLAYVLVTLAALYTSAFVAPILPVQALWLLGAWAIAILALGYRQAWVRYGKSLVGLAAIILGYIPYLALVLHYQSKFYAGASSARHKHGPLRLEIYWLALRDFFQLPAYQLWMVGALAGVGLSVRFIQKKWDAFIWLFLGIVQIAFVWSFVNGRRGLYFQSKYMLAAYLAICILAAMAFCYLPRRVHRGAWLLLPVVLGYLVFAQYHKFADYFASPRPLGFFQDFHKTLREQPGNKLVFFSIGYDGQHLEYQARKDSDIVVATMRGSAWASGGDTHLEPGYVAQVIDEAKSNTRCFYYVLNVSSARVPYEQAFVPRMHQFGYVLQRTLRVAGQETPEFCRP